MVVFDIFDQAPPALESGGSCVRFN